MIQSSITIVSKGNFVVLDCNWCNAKEEEGVKTQGVESLAPLDRLPPRFLLANCIYPVGLLAGSFRVHSLNQILCPYTTTG